MMVRMRLLLIGGIKHCGKSTLGRIIAKDTRRPFYDMDDLILAEADGAWKSVRSIYLNLGLAEFQALEEDAARNFVEWHLPGCIETGAVLALGGGTVENKGAMAWIGRKGTHVYVRADEELHYGRIMTKGRPPFLSEENPREDFHRLYEKRDALYTQFAHVIHDVDDAPPEINAQRLLVALEKHHER